MSTQQLQAKVRTETGSAAAKRLRRQGEIPAIAYGHGEEPRLLTLNAREVRHHLKHHGTTGLFTLKVEGEKDIPTIIRELQTNPVSHDLETIDFLRVSLSEEVHSQVPIVLEGEPIGVKQDGGILVHAVHTLEISALPQNLPEQIVVDVSALELNGPPILVSDLQLPEGVTAITDGEEAIAIVNVPAVEETVEEAEEAAEVPASDQGETAEGEQSQSE